MRQLIRIPTILYTVIRKWNIIKVGGTNDCSLGCSLLSLIFAPNTLNPFFGMRQQTMFIYHVSIFNWWVRIIHIQRVLIIKREEYSRGDESTQKVAWVAQQRTKNIFGAHLRKIIKMIDEMEEKRRVES